jgi:SAM-dependent methyltransferase
MLELGCGNAFHSYLLAGRFRRVIATDLMKRDARTHTIGLEQARSLAKILDVKNLRIMGASADALPLADESIDFVFSSNVLEHVPDQKRAVEEIYRVLRPGGKCLTIVPAAMERVYNVPVSYILIVQSVFRGLRSHLRNASKTRDEFTQASSGIPAAGTPAQRGFWDKARRFLGVHFPGFPFPNPHGEYSSSTEEFLAHRPGRWLRLFEEGGFRVDRSFTTILAPHTLGMAVSPDFAYWVARSGWPVTRLLGHRKGFKSLGTSFGMLVVRPGGEGP